MRLTLNQPEIEQAVRDYLEAQGFSRDIGAIDFTAGRGTTGLYAEINFEMGAAEPASPANVTSIATANDKAPDPVAEPATEEVPVSEEVTTDIPAEEIAEAAELVADAAQEDDANKKSLFS